MTTQPQTLTDAELRAAYEAADERYWFYRFSTTDFGRGQRDQAWGRRGTLGCEALRRGIYSPSREQWDEAAIERRALAAEREHLLARVAEIDAALAQF